jgi:hypothetical protein
MKAWMIRNEVGEAVSFGCVNEHPRRFALSHVIR